MTLNQNVADYFVMLSEAIFMHICHLNVKWHFTEHQHTEHYRGHVTTIGDLALHDALALFKWKHDSQIA